MEICVSVRERVLDEGLVMTRNIVLVTLDSLRADHCSFMGYHRETTPNFDDLADDGLVFENAMASGVPTIASMTSAMTGEYSWASPEMGHTEEQRTQLTSRRTIAEALSDGGYSTGAISPNPPASSYFGFDAGFDWFEDFLGGDQSGLRRLWSRVVHRSIQGGGPATYLRLARNVLRREEVLRPWESYYDRILEWRHRVSEPYFLWVLLLEPHHPWLPPSEHRRWSSRLDAYRSFRHYWQMLNEDWEPDFLPETRHRLLDLYDDSIRHGDAFIGRLRNDLADDDPVFIAHADHGEEFGEHGRYGHQPYLTENLTHVPLVIANADETGRVADPVGLRSLAPTIADLASIDASFPSRSLLADDQAPWTASTVVAEGTQRLAIRTEDYKYHATGREHQLYDLRLDPDEQVDRSAAREAAMALFDGLTGQHTAGEAERRIVHEAVRGFQDG